MGFDLEISILSEGKEFDINFNRCSYREELFDFLKQSDKVELGELPVYGEEPLFINYDDFIQLELSEELEGCRGCIMKLVHQTITKNKIDREDLRLKIEANY